MNPTYGYQVYQAERTRTRAEVLAEDVRRGRTAAAVRHGGQRPARAARAWGIMAMNTITGRGAGAGLAPHDGAQGMHAEEDR